MGSEAYPVSHGDKADFQDMLRLGKKQEFKVWPMFLLEKES